MTAAQASQQHNRSGDGRYAEKAGGDPGDLALSSLDLNAPDTKPDDIRQLAACVEPAYLDAWRNWEVRDSDIAGALDAVESKTPTEDRDILRWRAQDIMAKAVEVARRRRGPYCDNGSRHRWGHNASCTECTGENGWPKPIPAELDPQTWRDRAAAARRASARSFENSDTDGALSQWGSDLTAAKYDLQARIAENGGEWTFRTLFTLDRKPVPAKLVDTKYGQAWGLLNPGGSDSSFTGFVGSSQAFKAAVRDRNMAKKGYREGYVWAPAQADLGGSGSGLSGATSVYPYAKRLGDSFDPKAEFAGWDTEDLD